MSSISEESPLAEQLKNAVQAKVLEAGWTQDDDDTSLAEYIVLMVANEKTQEQIAAELSGELLQDAEGTAEFAQWLSDQVATLTGSANTHGSEDTNAAADAAPIPAAYENDLDDSAPDNAPRGPKSLHGGARGGRGSRGSAQGRGGFDSALHRTRGNDRINSHVRGAPKGPKSVQNKHVQPGMQKAMNGLAQGGQQAQNPMMQGSQQGGQFGAISPQQQMEFMAMMEQQARMFAQLMPNMMAPGINGNQQQQQQNGGPNGRSMFDRVDRGRGGGRGGRGRGGLHQNGAGKKGTDNEGETPATDGSAETASVATVQSKDPSQTACYFNLRCTNPECQYAHQSPAAPPGTEVDLNITCSFGADCANSQCKGKHPSPAGKIQATKAEQICKFFPNCSNVYCAFKHPAMRVCTFGASCTNKDCKYTHYNTKCRFNPCTNPRCPFMHDEGQNKGFAAAQWTKDQGTQGQEQSKDHLSNRKFVTEGDEELIKPESGENVESAATTAEQPTAETAT